MVVLLLYLETALTKILTKLFKYFGAEHKIIHIHYKNVHYLLRFD